MGVAVTAALGVAGVASHAAELGAADFRPTPEHPVGFRGDWTGRYPGATPPLGWSLTSNVVWKADVGGGESSPLVVGDRVFLLSDGIVLRWFDAATGELLWMRDRHARADVPGEAALAEIEGGVRAFHRLRPVREAIRAAEQRVRHAGGERR